MAFTFDRTPLPPTFRILTVCTGNICRSPFAEQYIRRGLDTAGVGNVVVESAGTMARDGQEMPDQAAELSRRYGADPSTHQARYLVEGFVSRADLVFAMGRDHRRAIVSMHPRASRTTFTLREFARLAEGMEEGDFRDIAALPLAQTAERFRALVAAVAARRGLVEPARQPEDDDIVDPYRLDDSVFDESGRQLVPAADIVVDMLRHAATTTAGTGTHP
ncbi:protein-tyrosine phosphatase [Frigoribacterium sp. PhB160]|uniref:arsenate reductase/protein-tyrosine-phosphatase family protein n=1 Tax=Frigoribacterium sp. PhB160 TaxID=2485192 RepID=UPI000F95DAEA|nr:low molecular weight phosphatase family protein [Frigoribacterium sp. PhB160]ROS60965.1 protein-tyrosine phosphatase [Frigoribacterium sp. PhB160]